MNFSNLKIGKSLTESRIAPDTTPEFVVSPTEGTMRINEPMANLLGVDYHSVNTEDKAEPGVRVDFRVLDDNSVFVYLCGPEDGAKLASPGKKTSGSLVFNHTRTWHTLEGENGFSVHYGVGVKVFGVDASGLITEEMAIEAGYLAEGKYTELAEEGEFGVAGETAAFGIILDAGEKKENTRNYSKDSDADVDGEEDVEDFG